MVFRGSSNPNHSITQWLNELLWQCMQVQKFKMISWTLSIVCYFHALGGQKCSLLVLPFFNFGGTGAGRERKEERTPFSVSCCPDSCTLRLHTCLQCSGRRKCEHNLTLSSFCFSVYSSNSYWGKKKKGGREESTVALNWSWNLSSRQFFVTQLESISFLSCPTLSTSLAECIMYQSGLLMCFCFERAFDSLPPLFMKWSLPKQGFSLKSVPKRGRRLIIRYNFPEVENKK